MHQAAGIEQMDLPAPVAGGLQNIVELQCRLTKQGFCTLLLKGCQTAQQRLAGARGHQGRVIAKHLWVVTQVIEQCLEVFKVKQQQPFPIRHLEGGIEGRLLAVGQLQQAAQQQGQQPQLGDKPYNPFGPQA